MTEHKVAKSSDLKLSVLLAVKVGSKKIVLIRTGEGRVCALEDCCSHMEVALSGGKVEGSAIECPAHGAKFDCCSGKALCMPAVTGVKAYKVKEVGDDLVIEL